MLGAFFLCNRDSLDAELIASGPDGRLPSVRANALTPVNIASLGEILGAGTYDEILEHSGDEHDEADTGESGVWDVPASVCEALAARGDLATVATEWVASEELRLDRWQADDGLSVLTQLSELLSHQAAGQVLWYWWSL